MDSLLSEIKSKIYDKLGWSLTNFRSEQESRDYAACRFDLQGYPIIGRSAKITPKKVGQFVTLWKRIGSGPIEPLTASEDFHFCIVAVESDGRLGQFVFPKSALVAKGVLQSEGKLGKRAFRVYPSWDRPESKQARRSQKWQLDYFYEVQELSDFDRIKRLFQP